MGEYCIHICLGGQVKGLQGLAAVLNNAEVKLLGYFKLK